jgi:two-component system, NtrC family, sensor kinase
MSNGPEPLSPSACVVGAEKGFHEIVAAAEIAPLLAGAVRAGAAAAAVTGLDGSVLWDAGVGAGAGGTIPGPSATRPLFLEGEHVGNVVVFGGGTGRPDPAVLADLLAEAVTVIATNTLKRVLTAETHAEVVSASYEELLETNRKLAASEQRYRELAETLERKVRERTEELSRAYARLLQREKMASIGRLAAGVAHEINNPMSFIAGNVGALGRYASRFGEMLDLLRRVLEQEAIGPGDREAVRTKWRELRIDFLLSDVEDLVRQTRDGAARVTKIISDLRGFSHIDDGAEAVVDLNEEIDRTLRVLAREIPPGTEIRRDFAPLPGFRCNPALLCQVFLNVLLNAFQARREGLVLAIRTFCEGGAIRAAFADNGPGIPEEIRGRIFEPFFTTKEVGAGTGMGLTVAYDIVTGYGGTIEADSPPGGGAVFRLTLPLPRVDHVEVR